MVDGGDRRRLALFVTRPDAVRQSQSVRPEFEQRQLGDGSCLTDRSLNFT